ncbi:MAG: enoyl-CoA hydratase-related protein, partial [Sphingomonadales bacterium]
HGLVLQIIEYPVPVLVAVQGQCLGGGLEIAAAGDLMFAAPDAKLGQPEIKLGVIAPAASCLLPEKIGQARALDLLLSGRSMTGREAAGAGLVTAVSDVPSETAVDYFDKHFAPLSAAALRIAVVAGRAGFVERVRGKIALVEKLYLEDLMATRDAVEGLTAFVEKRVPCWENR